MVPDEIAIAAGLGDVAPIEAWLNEGNDHKVNDRDVNGDTMLLACAATPHTRTASHTDLVRLLIERGADVNSLSPARHDVPGYNGLSALHYACDRIEDVSADMVSLLLNAKANVHCRARDASNMPAPEGRTYPEVTPLGMTLLVFFPDEGDPSPAEPLPNVLRVTTMLLRAGASLDAVSDERTAETELRTAEGLNPAFRNNDTFVQVKALIHGVRAAGNWKQYCRRDHKQILRLRSLVARGRARERLATSRAMKFIVRQGDNGIVWTILSFWQATN